MPKTLSFTVESTVGASTDAVWEVLGDFGTEHRWTKSLEHCERDTESSGWAPSAPARFRNP
jgi:hypothetical protein